MSKYPKYPEVEAYEASEAFLKVRPELEGVWLVPCPYCDSVHSHSETRPDGTPDRVPHCPHPDSPTGFLLEGKKRPSMYRLKLAGTIDDDALFDEAAERRRAKYKAHYDGFERRHADRIKASRAASKKRKSEARV